MVERHEVISAYRFLLARDPENEVAITRKLPQRDWVALREAFISSAEYKAKQFLKPPERYTTGTALDIDVKIPAEKFARLLRHVHGVWEYVGKERPHWSVLTNPDYLPERIEENMDQFYATGLGYRQRLEAALSRSATPLPNGRCLELGCGVGRVTAHLAPLFDEVIGLDISKPHLELARQHFAQLGLKNVELKQLHSLDDFSSVGSISVFYSTLVLQHNPPPLMFVILDRIFDILKPGGVAFFQVPVFGDDYSFNIDRYLDGLGSVEEHGIEMHVLPQRYIFSLFEKHGMKLLDLLDDGNAGPRYLSHQFLAKKALK